MFDSKITIRDLVNHGFIDASHVSGHYDVIDGAMGKYWGGGSLSAGEKGAYYKAKRKLSHEGVGAMVFSGVGCSRCRKRMKGKKYKAVEQGKKVFLEGWREVDEELNIQRIIRQASDMFP